MSHPAIQPCRHFGLTTLGALLDHPRIEAFDLSTLELVRLASPFTRPFGSRQ